VELSGERRGKESSGTVCPGRKLHREITREYRPDLYFGEEANPVIPCLLY